MCHFYNSPVSLKWPWSDFSCQTPHSLCSGPRRVYVNFWHVGSSSSTISVSISNHNFTDIRNSSVTSSNVCDRTAQRVRLSKFQSLIVCSATDTSFL